jgi:hypothetical protein
VRVSTTLRVLSKMIVTRNITLRMLYRSKDRVARDGEHFRILRFRRQKVITVVLNTEHDVVYTRDSASRAHSRSTATHIAEVEKCRQTKRAEKTPRKRQRIFVGNGNVVAHGRKDQGVYVQSEVVSLTRNIPVGLGWMIDRLSPLAKGVSTFTLEATRKSVLARLGASNSSGWSSVGAGRLCQHGFRHQLSQFACVSGLENFLAAVCRALAAMASRSKGI